MLGGGVVGMFTALALAQHGFIVTLLERNTLGGEASWAGGGILFPLLPWHYPDAVNNLVMRGAADYQSWQTILRVATNIDIEYQRCGMAIHDEQNLIAALNWCKAHAVVAEQRDQQLWLPEVAQVRNPYLMQALKRYLPLQGVSVHEHCTVSAIITGQYLQGWRTPQGQVYSADYHIITTGAWSQPWTPTGQVWPIRGQMLLYRVPPSTLRHIIYKDNFYLIPRLDGHLLVGSTLENVGFDKSITNEAKQDLIRKAHNFLPMLKDQTVLRQWSGLRPASHNNLPLITRHQTLCNVFLNTGHFRYGVSMAPASAQCLLDTLLQSEAIQP